ESAIAARRPTTCARSPRAARAARASSSCPASITARCSAERSSSSRAGRASPSASRPRAEALLRRHARRGLLLLPALLARPRLHVLRRGFAAEPAVEPVEVHAVVERHLAPARPVTRVRIDDEARGHALLLQRGEVREALRVRAAVVALAGD